MTYDHTEHEQNPRWKPWLATLIVTAAFGLIMLVEYLIRNK